MTRRAAAAAAVAAPAVSTDVVPLRLVAEPFVCPPRFAEWMRSWGASERTIEARTAIINAGLRTWGDPTLVTRDALQEWLANPAWAPWTRVAYFNHMRSFFRWLEDNGHIPVDPTVKMRPPRTPKDKPRPLSEEEVERALSAASGRLRDWLLIGLLTGLRVHEIAKLRGEDVTAREVFVVGKGLKEATIPTHPAFWAMAQRYPREGWWFPTRFRPSSTGHVNRMSITTAVTKHFRSLGIEGSIHRARHTYATNLLRGGANMRVVMELCRHESIATTAKYTAVDEGERIEALNALPSYDTEETRP